MGVVVLFLLVVPLFLCGANTVLNRRPNTNPHRTPFTSGLYTNIVLVPVYLGLHLYLFGAAARDLICGIVFILIYLNSLVFLNWFIFTLTDVSMHIQLLLQIHKQGSVTTAQLTERYNKNTILTNRIPRLLELNQLRMTDGLLFVGGRSVLFGAAICVLLRRILGIPVRPEEVDHSATA